MKVQEVISSCIMFIVSGLVLVGFTIAWFTNNNMPAVTGLAMQAVEMGHVKVALTTPNGPDISELPEEEQYAEVVIAESPGADTEERTIDGVATLVPLEFAPGAYGTVTFYVTPVNNSRVTACDIVPTLQITQDGSTWYPVTESVSDEENATDNEVAETDEETTGDSETEASLTVEELYAIAQKHIKFFSDEAMTEVITEDVPYQLTWTDEDAANENPVEKTATIYWKWYYEWYEDYPLTEDEALKYTTEKELIRKYDNEDMQLGNNITNMKFYFTFTAR